MKKDNNSRYNLRERNNKTQYEKEESFSDESSDEDYDTSDEEYIDENDELDIHQYRKFLSKLFPSKYMEQKVKDTELGQKKKQSRRRSESSSPSPEPRKKQKTINENKHKKCEEDNEEDDDNNEEDDNQEDEVEENKQPQINIVLNLNNLNGMEEDDEEDNSEKEDDEEEEDDDKYTIEDTPNNHKAIEEISKLLTQAEKDLGAESDIVKELRDTLKQIKEDILKKQTKKDKKQKNSNTLKFNKLIREKNMMNDLNYFKEKLSLEEQKSVITKLEDVLKYCNIDKPYKLTLLDADIPTHYKAIAYKKINSLKSIEPSDTEYYKIKTWVDTFMRIPFGNYKNLPVTLENDGIEKCSSFIETAKETLDNAVYGMNDVKLQIMQMLGQYITNPNAIGTAIAIKGPMGTGKTTIVKDGISKILGRDFAFIALGGATDSCFLEGHSYTYQGSTYGKIIDILVQCKSMNPVIFFDELDKVSDTPKGDEIIGILTHLIDTSQNTKFHDKYFSEIEFDLSKALFIFSYNDEKKINPILLDRMYKIETKGYETKEKIVIANNYLLPKICSQISFTKEDITIPETTMQYIIENYTEKEQGVRNIKRCLEIIYTKLNLYRLMKPGTKLFEKEMSLQNIKFPLTVTNEIVDKLIKINKEKEGNWKNMYL